MRKPLLLISGLFIIICIVYFSYSIFLTRPGFPLDDSWIHQVFARNLASCNGFSFNAGEPVAGATAPLWSLFLAIPQKIMGPVASGVILGALLMWLAMMAIYRIGLVISGEKNLAVLTTLVAVLCWIVIWNGLSGMESGLFSSLSLWGIYYYITTKMPGDRKNLAAYILISLSFLARPECAIFLAYIFIMDMYLMYRRKAGWFWPLAWRIIIVALILTPYFIFNYSTTGTLFPQTFTAKVMNKGLLNSLLGGDIKRLIKSFAVFPLFYIQDFMRLVFMLNPILILGLFAGVLKLFFSKSDNDNSGKLRALAIVILIYTPLMGAISPMAGPGFQHFRLTVHLVPLLFLLGMIGLFQEAVGPNNRALRFILLISGLLMAGAVIMYLAREVIGSRLAPYLIQSQSTFSAKGLGILKEFIHNFTFGLAVTAAIAGAGAVIMSKNIQIALARGNIRKFLIGAIMVYAVALLIYRIDTYAYNVKNINECDRASGEFIASIAKPGDIVGINDIGAIGYFSGCEILDLKGLVSPQISTAMIQNDSLAFEYMKDHKQVAYLAINDGWFDYIIRRDDIFQPVRYFVTDKNTILYDDTLTIYKADWGSISR